MKLQPYNSYQSLDIEWNQSAPSHWRSSRLKFDSYIKARVGWHGLKSDEFTEEGPYLITGSDFSGKVIDWSKCYHCEVERYEQDPYIQLKDDDLLITKDGTIGKVILTGKLPDKATLNSGVFVLRPLKERYDTKYYYWLMQSSVFHGFVEYYRTGSTIAHLYQETFCNLPYAIPPLDEQAQISTFLDRETAKIDRLIEKQQRLIELLEEKRQAVISHAVTKGLNPDAPMKDSGVEWLGDIPQHWDMKRLKHISPKIGVGLVINPSTYTKDEGLHFIFGGNVVPYGFKLEGSRKISKEDSLKLHQSRLRTNDIVTVRVGAPGVTAVIDEKLCDSNCASVMITRRGNYNSDWLCACMNSPVGMAQVKRVEYGAAQKQFNISDAIEFVFPAPPKHEQDEIAKYVCVMLNKFDKLITTVSKQIHLLQERRIALISAAVTGKIDVRDQVPQDVEEAVTS